MAETHCRFLMRIWTLHELKQNGFTTDELSRIYTPMILPSAEYVEYHALITREDSDELELIQCQALKAIYG